MSEGAFRDEMFPRFILLPRFSMEPTCKVQGLRREFVVTMLLRCERLCVLQRKGVVLLLCASYHAHDVAALLCHPASRLTVRLRAP